MPAADYPISQLCESQLLEHGHANLQGEHTEKYGIGDSAADALLQQVALHSKIIACWCQTLPAVKQAICQLCKPHLLPHGQVNLQEQTHWNLRPEKNTAASLATMGGAGPSSVLRGCPYMLLITEYAPSM